MKDIFILEDMEIRLGLFREVFMNFNFTIVKSAKEAIEILKNKLDFDVFFLDHDLGDRIFVDINDKNTGSVVAKFLSDKEIKGDIIIHSYNPIGAKNMLNLLPQAVYYPFSYSLLLKVKEKLEKN